MKRKDGRYRTASKQGSIREQVIDYLKKNGGTQGQAAKVFGLHMGSVSRMWARYKAGGDENIKSKKRGMKRGRMLNGVDSDEMRQLIKDKLPDQLKLPFGLWSREAVKQLLIQRYGTGRSRSQMGRQFKNWGYTSQKILSASFKQKPKRAKEWLKKEYPAIKKRAIKEKAAIYFGDESGMRSGNQTGAGHGPHGPAGESPEIKTTKPHFLPNMISAIGSRDHLQFMMIEEPFNSDLFQFFLQQMIKHGKQKIFFITDGYFAYKTKKLDEWLEKNSKQIEVFFLPPCNPD